MWSVFLTFINTFRSRTSLTSNECCEDVKIVNRWYPRPTPKPAVLMHKARVALLLLLDSIMGYLSRVNSLTKGPSVFDAYDMMAAYYTTGLRVVMGQIVSGLPALGAVARL